MAVGKILFLYNAVPDVRQQKYSPGLVTFSQIELLSQALTETGNQVIHLNLRRPEQLRDFIQAKGPFSIVFCIAEGFLDLPATIADGSGAAWIRRMLVDLGVEATHSTATAMEVCWHKDRTHQALKLFDIPTPEHVVIQPEPKLLEQQLEQVGQELSFPLFVKPAVGGTSVGIYEQSLVNDPQELAAQVRILLWEFKNVPILVETYLPGREYTVGVIGNREKLVPPIIAFPTDQKVRTRKVKRNRDESKLEKITAGDPLYQLLSELAINVFEAVGAQDVLRIDFREDAYNKPMVIDVNGSPALTPTASLAFMAAWAGLSYSEFVRLLLNVALERVYGQADGQEIA
ncbi:MAG: hypothetical protein GX952_04870 [Firmicutes bacterium]|nr:hypothetical protein [Bacillota bacterium]